jgi:hypothetical protein
MTSAFSFKCATSSGSDLCFFGGVCQELNDTIQQEFCVCPQGYGHDFSFFHSSNCALPDLTLEIFAGVISVVWLVELIWYVNKVRQLSGRKRVVQLARVGLIQIVSLELLVIGLATQSGFFEVGIIAFCIAVLCLNLFIQMITLQMFQFAHAMYSTRVKQMELVLNYGLAAIFVVVISGCGVSLAFARVDEVWKIDAALCVVLSSNYLALVILCSVAWKYMNEFVNLLTTSANNELQAGSPIDYTSVLNRLQKMKRVISNIVFTQVSSVVLLFIVRFVLGSFPFTWVLFFLAIIIAHAVPIGIASLFPEFDKSSSDGKKSSKRAIVTGTQIDPSNIEFKVSSSVIS